MTSLAPSRVRPPHRMRLSVPSPLRCSWPVPPQRLGDLTACARWLESPRALSAPGAGVAIHPRRAA